MTRAEILAQIQTTEKTVQDRLAKAETEAQSVRDKSRKEAEATLAGVAKRVAAEGDVLKAQMEKDLEKEVGALAASLKKANEEIRTKGAAKKTVAADRLMTFFKAENFG